MTRWERKQLTSLLFFAVCGGLTVALILGRLFYCGACRP